MDKNNILFVGNGIDLLDGYKTDYVSFLLSEKEEYKNLFIKGIEKCLNSKKYVNNITLEEKNVDLYGYIDMAYINQEENKLMDVFRDINITDVATSTENKDVSNGKTTLKFLDFGIYTGFKNELALNSESDFFNVTELKKEDVDKAPIPNFWISYFIKCYLDGVLSGVNWIDLEGLIYENSKKINSDDSSSVLGYTIAEHKRKFFEKEHDIYEDFLKLKEKLCNYLYNAKKMPGDLNKLHSEQLTKYGTILNFNYSTSDLLSNTINNTSIDEFFIHGTISDKCDIVFGYDDGMITNLITNAYEYENTELYKMSKTYQLLKLSLKHQNGKMERNIKIPEKKDINYVGILGHSISEADYNYFSTLCNFETVIIEVFWYDYFIKDSNGKSVKKDNQISLMESLIAMIHEMEKQSKTKILHKMLIEQRIIFRKVIS